MAAAPAAWPRILPLSGKADIVYGVGASVWGYAKARRAGAAAPLVFNPQGLEEFGGMDGSYGGHALKGVGYAPLRAVVRDCAAASDAVIATDQAIVPAVLRHLPVGQDRVHLIPNGIDVHDLDALVDPAAGRAARARAGIADDETVFVSVGRLEANKGFADLAEALAQGALTVAAGGGCSWATVPNAGALKRWSIACASETACASSAGSMTTRCTPGTTPPICSSIPRATKAARW